MRRILLGCCAFALSAGVALAADAPSTTAAAGGDLIGNGLVGNTVVVVGPTGMESHTYYNADHTFSGIVPSMGYKYGGTWTTDEKGQVCRTFDPPVPGRTNPDCDPADLTPHAVGDSWTAPDGSKISLTAGQN